MRNTANGAILMVISFIKDIDELINFLTEHMSNDNFPKEQARAYFEEQIPKLKHWSGNK